MTGYPRRDRDGNLVPWLSDYLRGRQEIQGQGLAHPPDADQVAELGRALADQAPPWTPEERAEVDRLIAQKQEQNRKQKTRLILIQELNRHHVPHQLEPAPEPPNPIARGSDNSDTEAEPGPGGPDQHRAGPEEGSDRLKKTDPIKWYLQNVPDPDDEDWTPS